MLPQMKETKILTMSILGDDEIEEILLRLPAIDLVCYKAVCKGWRSLISSAEFVSAHLKRSKSNPSNHFLFVHNDPHRAPKGSSQSIASYCSECMVMVGSVNGLICMVGNPLPSHRDIGIFIWNPITGLSTELPHPSSPSTFEDVDMIKFAFWCDDSDGGGGVYKVAKLFREYFSPFMVEVWVSSFPDKWTTVTTADHDLNCHGWVSGPQVLIEGLAAYWTVFNADDVIFVLLLDLKTLALEAIPLSEVEACLPADEYGYSLYCANFKGEFVLVQRTSSPGDGIYDIWTMRMDGSRGNWKKSSTFRLGYPFDRCLGSVNGKLLVLLRRDNGITLYDMETGKHDVLGKDSDPYSRASAHGFVGSLVSIDGFETSDLYAGISWPNSFASGRVLKMKMQPPPPFMHPPWGQMQMYMPPQPH